MQRGSGHVTGLAPLALLLRRLLIICCGCCCFFLPCNCNSQDNALLVPSNRDFYIAVLLPIHEKDNNPFFGCGSATKKDTLYQLSALIEALNASNEESLLRTGISVGLVVLDYCDRPVRATDLLYRLLTNESLLHANSIVAVVSVEEKATLATLPLTKPNNLVHIVAPLRPEINEDDLAASVLPVTIPLSEWIRAIGDFLDSADVELVSVVYADDDQGKRALKRFIKVVTDKGVCVVGTVAVSGEKEISLATRRLVNVRGQVTVVLFNDPMWLQTFLGPGRESNSSNDWIYVVNDAVLPYGIVTNTSLNVIAVGFGEWSVSDGFLKFLDNLTPDGKDPWLLDVWQNFFKCWIPNGNQTGVKSLQCTGNERPPRSLAANPSVHRLSLAVRGISVGLQNFLTRHCSKVDQKMNIDECGPTSRLALLRETQRALVGDNDRGQKPLVGNAEGTRDILFTYYARQLYGEDIIPNKLGMLRNRFIPLINGLPNAFRKNNPTESPCIDICARVCPLKAASFVPSVLDPTVNFRSAWGIIASALSGLGMIGVIACLVYFVVVVPTRKGTALLDYLILVGIFLEYGVNFAFVAVATDSTCVLRRLVLGVGYALVFSAKLVKVVNTWRVCRTDSTSSSVASSTSSRVRWEVNPSFAILITLALTSFQTGIAIAWLILSPSTTTKWTQNNITIPLCSPGERFEETLVLSLLYVLVLMALVVGFSFVTRKVEIYNQESRWIFLSTSLNVLVWVIWTIVATMGEVSQRSSTIVVGNLLCATITLLCLFLPKIYLYGTLLKQAKKLDIRAFYPQSKRRRRPMQPITALYDPLQYGSVNSSCTSINGLHGTTTTRVSATSNHHKGPMQQNGTMGNKSTGERQTVVTTAERLPRLIYDNRSQFQVQKGMVNGLPVNRMATPKRNGHAGKTKPPSSRNVEYF